MRLLLLAILVFPLGLLADTDRTFISNSPDSSLHAYLKPGRDKEAGGAYTEIDVLDRDEHKLYSGIIPMAAERARWTMDSKFLVVSVATNTEGHTKTPWRYDLYLVALARKQWRYFNGSNKVSFISPEIWCQAPDTITLVGCSAYQSSEPPDDPILVRYKAGKLWSTLK